MNIAFESRERNRSYGEVAVIFANAKDADSACTEIGDKLQVLMDYPPSFADKLKQFFPRWGKITAEFNPNQKQLLELMVRILGYERIINKDSLSEYFESFNKHPKFDQYINRLKSLEIDSKSHSRWRKEVISLTKKLDDFQCNEVWEIFENKADIVEGYILIKSVRREILETFETIYNGKNLSETGALGDALDNYEECVAPRLLLNNDGTFSFKSYMIESLESHVFKKYPWDSEYVLFDSLVNDLCQVVRFCFIEFIKHQDNWCLINYCNRCKSFFIAKTKRKQKFCSDKCRLSFHNRIRIKTGEHAKYKREKRLQGKYQ